VAKKSLAHVTAATICLAIALLALFPLLWMGFSGFKSAADVLSIPFRLFPRTYHPENYANLLSGTVDATVFPKGASFVRSMLLTFFVSSVSVVLSLMVNSMAGFVFARLRFPFKKVLWVLYLVPWFIPGISVVVTQFLVVSKLSMLNSLAVLILPGIAWSYSIFFYRQFYLGIPQSLEEAAKMDGASFSRIYTRIFFPMSGTPFVIMGLSVFLGYWSSFLWPILTVSDPSLFQINQLVSYFKSSYNRQMHYVMAASTITAVPTIVLFLLFQGKILLGIKISGLK
jgi:multiple sugar transport system permease protein